MPISVSCRECEASYRVPDDAAGKAIKCRKCGARIAVPLGAKVVIPPEGKWHTERRAIRHRTVG
jgi:predicted Zn finger-like uncharacterized protein